MSQRHHITGSRPQTDKNATLLNIQVVTAVDQSIDLIPQTSELMSNASLARLVQNEWNDTTMDALYTLSVCLEKLNSSNLPWGANWKELIYTRRQGQFQNSSRIGVTVCVCVWGGKPNLYT